MNALLKAELMQTQIYFNYRFHAAGQGIFASGTVNASASVPEFHWVFDCGSTSLKVLRPKIRDYRKQVVEDTLDLLCISHLHNDHVSGLSDLLKGIHVETIVMPYLTSLEKLVLGCISGRNRRSYVDFITNPVGFLLDHAASIGEIVFVGGPSGSPEGEPPVEYPDTPVGGRSKRPDDFKAGMDSKLEDCPPGVIDDDTRISADKKGTAIKVAGRRFIKRPICCLSAWEFLFFHKPMDANSMSAIRMGVELALRSGNVPVTPAGIESALMSKVSRKAIKDEYVRALSVTDQDINSTSLCVYAGPVKENLIGALTLPLVSPANVETGGDRNRIPIGGDKKASILYTGDADFLKPGNRGELEVFLTPERCGRVNVLQVPHHGSEKNWQVGRVTEFGQRHSVFCASGPLTNYGHPDQNVWDDPLAHGRVLVDKVNGCHWSGAAVFTEILSI